MTSVVVAEKDAVMRDVIAQTCQNLGLDVTTTVDLGVDLVEVVRRYGADVVVTERALLDGAVDAFLDEIRVARPDVRIVMFTSTPLEGWKAVNLGVHSSVIKPDLEQLVRVLVAVRDNTDHVAPPRRERRAPRRHVERLDAKSSTPHGVEPASALVDRLGLVEPGDTVLIVTFVDNALVESRMGARMVTRCQVEAGRLLRMVTRPPDAVIEQDDGTVVALLRGGDDRAARVVATRLRQRWSDSSLPGDLRIGGAVHFVGESPHATIARAHDLVTLT